MEGLMPTKKGNQVAVSGYLEPKMAGALDELCRKTRVPKAEYLREAISDLLSKYEVTRARATSGPPRNVHTVRRKKAKA